MTPSEQPPMVIVMPGHYPAEAQRRDGTHSVGPLAPRRRRRRRVQKRIDARNGCLRFFSVPPNEVLVFNGTETK
jgi:hypothetical protein